MSNDQEESAVREGRMVSREEAIVRKAAGTLLLGWSAWSLWSKGPSNVSASSTSFWLALGCTLLMSGVLNQCGCAIRLKWAVGDGVKRVATPEQYLPFMRAKRRQFFINVFGSAAAGLVATLALYTAAGVHGRRTSLGACKGTLTEVAAMLAMSLMA